MPTMLVLGATSDIARASMALLASCGWTFILAGRHVDAIREWAWNVAYSKHILSIHPFDATRTGDSRPLWDGLPRRPDVVLCAVGLLGDQEGAKHDADMADAVLRTNFTGLVPLLTLAADEFEHRRHGLIIGVSSVAGERGRYSNYVYGSAKAGFTAFLSGLRARLFRAGVRVITVKPGYVRTRMLDGRQTPPWLTASPDEVAAAVLSAIEGKRDVIHVKSVWRPVIAVMRLLPECVFKRLRY